MNMDPCHFLDNDDGLSVAYMFGSSDEKKKKRLTGQQEVPKEI